MKLIIFDIDGTLCNTEIIDDICFFGIFNSLYNCEIEKEKWNLYKILADCTDLAMFKYIHKELFNRTPELTEIQHFKDNFFTSLRSSWQTFPRLFGEVPGAKQFVENLYSRDDCKLAVATGCWSESALIKLQAIGLGHLNIPISCSDAIASRKHILSNACILAEEQYQSEGFDEIYYFGDGVWDYQSAKALNIKFIGVDYGNNNTFYDVVPDLIINNYFESADVIDDMLAII